jgi:3-mercaptopyruvate sulfurtransferase SseA
VVRTIYNSFYYLAPWLPPLVLLPAVVALPAAELVALWKKNDTTLVLYGDFNNWFAAFAFWVFKYYGYKHVRIINGGRKKRLIEDRLTTKDIPQYPKGNFIAVTDTDTGIRAFFSYVRGTLENNGSSSNTVELVDVRGPKRIYRGVSSSTRISH